MEAYESDARGYFPCCPLCGSNQIVIKLIRGGRDTLSCESCKAHWHLYVGVGGLKWAELDLASENGEGMSLIGKRLKKEEWRKMAQNARKAIPPPPPARDSDQVAREKEIIRQKEVIVKIRCPYCKNLYSETEDKCPHCGAKA